jgi:hypothetical protein
MNMDSQGNMREIHFRLPMSGVRRRNARNRLVPGFSFLFLVFAKGASVNAVLSII